MNVDHSKNHQWSRYVPYWFKPKWPNANSPYSLPYIAYNVSSENLVLNQTIIP